MTEIWQSVPPSLLTVGLCLVAAIVIPLGLLLLRLQWSLSAANRRLAALEVTVQKEAKTLRSKVLRDMRITARKEYRLQEAYWSLTQVLSPREPLPPTRAWAASPDLLKYLYEQVRLRRPSQVMELGGGVSTLVIAYALSRNGHGKLISVDHDAQYMERTADTVKRHGLTDQVEFKLAPLEPFEGGEQAWYARAALDGLEPIDLLLVDGPPADTHDLARLPAIAALHGSLSTSALVLLDDGIRKAEQDIAAQWAKPLACEPEYLAFEKGLFVFDLANLSQSALDDEHIATH